jgi:hypothetical protein
MPNVDVVTLAVPAMSDFDPRVFVPDLKITVPVGVPDVEDVTVAVKVTGSPVGDGFSDDVNEVVVPAFVTTWDIGGDVLVALFPSPLYTAVIVCVPTVSAEVASIATPLLFNVIVPKFAPPFLNVMVPVGTPLKAEVTLALNTASRPKLTFPTNPSVTVVANLLTVCLRTAELFDRNDASPGYVALIE